MHRSLPLSSTLAALAVLVFAGAGCDGRHTADAYPDRSTESRNRADAIRSEGDQRKIAVERERQEKTAAERFRATQVRVPPAAIAKPSSSPATRRSSR